MISAIATQRAKIGIMGIGLAVNEIMDYLFDFALYPYVVIKLGMIKGGIIMSLASFLICWLLMVFYDWSKKDWLGIEMVKEAKHYKGSSKIRAWVAKIMGKSDLFAIVILSLNFDPFVTTAYMRKGAGKYNGMWRRDWQIFFFSWIVGDAYWTVLSFYGATFVMHYGSLVVNAFGLVAKVMIVLAILTVIFKRKLFFIASFFWCICTDKIRKRTLAAVASEVFAWVVIIYYVIRIGGDVRFLGE